MIFWLFSAGKKSGKILSPLASWNHKHFSLSKWNFRLQPILKNKTKQAKKDRRQNKSHKNKWDKLRKSTDVQRLVRFAARNCCFLMSYNWIKCCTKGTQNNKSNKPVPCVSQFISTLRYSRKIKCVILKRSVFTQDGKEIKTEALG